MVRVDKDCHLGRGDHLEYLAIADKTDREADAISAVRKVFQEKFGNHPRKITARQSSNGAWLVQVYPSP